jgi:hypothetical protein
VTELGTGESRGGRKPVFYGLNPSVRYILGIEMTKNTPGSIFSICKTRPWRYTAIDIELDNAPGTFEN